LVGWIWLVGCLVAVIEVGKLSDDWAQNPVNTNIGIEVVVVVVGVAPLVALH
jgi:hypothetical protein